jgi:hypothetical protein
MDCVLLSGLIEGCIRELGNQAHYDRKKDISRNRAGPWNGSRGGAAKAEKTSYVPGFAAE